MQLHWITADWTQEVKEDLNFGLSAQKLPQDESGKEHEV